MENSRGRTLRLGGIGACVAVTVSFPDFKTVHGVPARDSSCQHQQKGCQPGGYKTEHIVHMGRGTAEIQVFLVFIADHAVHGIDALIKERQRGAADHHVEKGRDHTVRQIFRSRFNCGPGHARVVQGSGIPAHDPGHLFPGFWQIACLQHLIYRSGFPDHIPDCQALPAPDCFQKKTEQGMDPLQRKKKDGRQRQTGRGHERRQQAPGHPLSRGRISETLAQSVFQKCDGLSHDHDRMCQPGRIPCQQIEQKTEQDGKGDGCYGILYIIPEQGCHGFPS